MKPEGSRPAAGRPPRQRRPHGRSPWRRRSRRHGLRPVLPPAEIGKEAPIADASLIFCDFADQALRVFLMTGISAPTTTAARMISRRPCRPTKAMMKAKTLVVPIMAAKP